jgi:hypothetical protein
VNSVLQKFNFLNFLKMKTITCYRDSRAARMEQPESYPCALDGIIAYERKAKQTQEVFPAFPGVSMPGKSMPGKVKTRKTNDLAVDLWVAPRPPSQKQPRIYEPVAGSRLNRYLEFADIALGVKKTTPHGKKPSSGSGHGRQAKKHEPKVVPIDGVSSARRGFGAFRNSR